MVIKYIVVLLCSFFGAYLLTCFKKAYTDSEKFKLINVLKNEKLVYILLTSSYTISAVYILMFYEKKGMSFFPAMEALFFWNVLVAVAMIDIKQKKIPNALIIVLFAGRCVGIAVEVLVGHRQLVEVVLFSALGMAVGAFVMLVCMFFSRGGVGAGDLKLYAMVGLYFGLVGLVNIMFYSIFSSALFGIGMLVSKKAKLKTSMPMAPFILLGTTLYIIMLRVRIEK